MLLEPVQHFLEVIIPLGGSRAQLALNGLPDLSRLLFQGQPEIKIILISEVSTRKLPNNIWAKYPIKLTYLLGTQGPMKRKAS